MLGWLRADAALASRRNRAKAWRSRATSSGRNLRATKRSRRVSSALYTTPIPPPPNFSTMRSCVMVCPIICAEILGLEVGQVNEGREAGGSPSDCWRNIPIYRTHRPQSLSSPGNPAECIHSQYFAGVTWMFYFKPFLESRYVAVATRGLGTVHFIATFATT